MREFTIDLADCHTFEEFVTAFNRDFCGQVGGKWHGKSWNAFNDYLSWPEEDHYRFILKGWDQCSGLSLDDRQMLKEIFKDNSNVELVFA
jgi:hypothetical protein